MQNKGILLSKLIKIYEHPDNKHGIIAVRDVTVKLNKGKIIVISGPSGSGKTTLLKIIGGLIRPSAGQVKIDNLDITNLSIQELKKYRSNMVGYIFQDPRENLLNNLSVLENMIFHSELTKTHINNERRCEILEILGILDKKENYPYQLSGGEAQRVNIAIAMQNNPSIIIADEPTAHIDYQTTKVILKYLIRISELVSSTIIIASHDPEVIKFADIHLKLLDGKLLEEL